MNVDFLDVKVVLQDSKDTIIRVGEAKGGNAVDKIIEQIKKNNLFEGKLEDAKRVLINFIAAEDVSLEYIRQITERISDIIEDKNVNLIWGVIFNQNYRDVGKIKTVVISSV